MCIWCTNRFTYITLSNLHIIIPIAHMKKLKLKEETDSLIFIRPVAQQWFAPGLFDTEGTALTTSLELFFCICMQQGKSGCGCDVWKWGSSFHTKESPREKPCVGDVCGRSRNALPRSPGPNPQSLWRQLALWIFGFYFYKFNQPSNRKYWKKIYIHTEHTLFPYHHSLNNTV